MNERDLGVPGPESAETEPIHQTLRKIASELRFSETPELQEIERQAIESSKSLDSPEAIAKFNDLIAQIQFLGEPITEQEIPKTGLSQIGLMAVRAATLYESGHLEDCRDEIYDILTALDNVVRDHPEVSHNLQEIENLYNAIKKELDQESENQSKENQELSPEERRAQIAEQNQKELIRRRELGELEPIDYEVNYIYYLQQMGEPVTRKDVKNHAIVIRLEEFEVLGHIEFVSVDGEIITIEFTDENFDTSKPLIIFPEELGEKTS